MIHPVILCGGSGARLWPASRADYPKQFSALLGDESLFQATVKRLSGPEFAAPLVMTHSDFRFIVMDQLGRLGVTDAAVMIEPEARNTAPAILVAALSLAAREADALMLVAPSDHVIADRAAFLEALHQGTAAAMGGALVTFGVHPDRPETGYGYLDLGGGVPNGAPMPLAGFTEKPSGEEVEAMLAAGSYLWNMGVFLFRASDIIAAFEAHAPQLLSPCKRALAGGAADLGFFRLEADAYSRVENTSIDYAIMEKAARIVAVPYAGGWSDLGAWDAIWQVSDTDAAGVATRGRATAIDCVDTLLRSEDHNLHVVGLGLRDIIAVAMRDAVLIADRKDAQRVKDVVTALRAEKVAQATHFPQFHRPWGWYETLCLGGRFQVKRIMVKPGGALSLQSHVHRAEHWVVVEGTARVTVGDEVRLVAENESVYIPLGAVHRLENPGRLPMYLIEVQTGAYLGEDDIVRYEDAYDRA